MIPKHPPSAALERNLRMIVASGRRLGTLVNDILDFSKLRHEDIVLSHSFVDLNSVVDLVCSLSSPLLEKRDIRLINHVDGKLPNVLADENRLQQIMHNLIGNAIKFTHQGSVTINAHVIGDTMHVAITDTGIGIPPDRIGHIFESFNQGGGSIQREYGGTGLGLSITRKLFELHGGSIDVTSTPGLGSTFTFTLPLAEPDQATADRDANEGGISATRPALSVPTTFTHHRDNAKNEHGDATAPLSTPHETQDHTADSRETKSQWILVVDDEPINRQVLMAQLSSAGFGVVEAQDGEEALAIMARDEHRFDLVLLDVMMPRLSGFDTCKALRQKYMALQLPVIFLTARSQIEDVLTGFAAGGNDNLVKPLSRDELLARIRIHLELITTHRIIREYSKNLEDKVAERSQALINTQQELVLKQKMAALGVLTTGVAHEINNPNNFVQVASQNLEAWQRSFREFIDELLGDKADQDILQAFNERFGKMQKQIELINTGSQRIDCIVKGLRVITRLDEAKRQQADVIEGLEQTLVLLQPSVADSVHFVAVFADRPSLLCWPAELNQVFMNVLMNAVHASRDQLRTTGETGPLDVRIGSHCEGGHLVIVIRDEGAGMSRDVLEKACDPFFTTREVGAGAGLGLSISRDIMGRHGGELTLASEPGSGTTVTLRLPLT